MGCSAIGKTFEHVFLTQYRPITIQIKLSVTKILGYEVHDLTDLNLQKVK
jgi:hypothetical protein